MNICEKAQKLVPEFMPAPLCLSVLIANLWYQDTATPHTVETPHIPIFFSTRKATSLPIQISQHFSHHILRGHIQQTLPPTQPLHTLPQSPDRSELAVFEGHDRHVTCIYERTCILMYIPTDVSRSLRHMHHDIVT